LPTPIKKLIQRYGDHPYVEPTTGDAWADHWTPDRLGQLAELPREQMEAAVKDAARMVTGEKGPETLMRQIEIETEKRGKFYGDPSSRHHYDPGQEEAVWNAAVAKHPEGWVFHPGTDTELFWDQTKSRAGQWDMGHRDGQKYEVWHRKYLNDEITYEQFLEWYRSPEHYQPELPSINRGNNHRQPQ
jgi:hypothetical protein